MLKIKDNVDLKELEKYGLKLKYECNEDSGVVYVTEIYKLHNDYQYSIRFASVPEYFELRYVEPWDMDIIYDLIKDGLVIKEDD